jgi:type VII secretion integral membrane protein EccD
VNAGLARVTVASPQRRVDVALPDAPPLAELLPELLGHAGVDLADAGERHGGWLLRRADGSALAEADSLAAQGVHDGDVLHLVPARADWPELEYDDVVEAIAAGARRSGAGWSGGASRVSGLVVAGGLLAVALFGVVRSGPPWSTAAVVSLAVAGALLVAGVLAVRAYGEALVGVVLGGYALPYAFVGGLFVFPPRIAAPHVLVGCVAVLVASLLGALGVGVGLRVFAAGATAGLAGGAGALLGYVSPAAGAAAVVLAGLVIGAAALPLLAIRLGRLPVLFDAAAPVDGPGVYAAVARTDDLLTGMLVGLVPVGVVAALVVARSGGVAGWVLVAVAATAFLLRARLFVTVWQRLPVLASGVLGYLVPAALAALRVPLPAVVVLVVAGVVVAAAGSRYAHRTPSPYLGRAADVLDALCVVSVLPLACGVLGLYARVRGFVS